MRVIAAVAALLLFIPSIAAQVGCAPQDCVVVDPPIETPFVTGAKLDHVTVNVEVIDGIIITTYTTTVTNHNNVSTQASLAFPLSRDSAVLSMLLLVDGKVLVGRAAEAGQARTEFNQAATAGLDAALLSRADERQVRLALSIAPGDERIVQLRTVSLVESAANHRIVRVPTSLLQGSGADIDLSFSIRDAGGLSTLHFPEQAAQIQNDGTSATASTRTTSQDVKDWVAVWQDERPGWSIRAITSAAPGTENATTLILVDQPLATEIMPRDVVFVIDSSGSMKGDKMGQAKDALTAALGQLGSNDRFAVIDFSGDAKALTDGLEWATQPTINLHQSGVANIQAGGGTNIHEALMDAFDLLGPGQAIPQVVLITDGMPSSGITNHKQILADVAAYAGESVVHVVAVGLDADRSFLRDMADQSGGSLVPLEPRDGNLTQRMAALLHQLGRPVATQIEVAFDGYDIQDAYPQVVPSLHVDETIAVIGHGNMVNDSWGVTVTGQGADGGLAHTQQFASAELLVVPEISLLWGVQHVEALLARERAGEDVRQQITQNATAYGIVTDYTSWIVTALPGLEVDVNEVTQELPIEEILIEITEIPGIALPALTPSLPSEPIQIPGVQLPVDVVIGAETTPIRVDMDADAFAYDSMSTSLVGTNIRASAGQAGGATYSMSASTTGTSTYSGAADRSNAPQPTERDGFGGAQFVPRSASLEGHDASGVAPLLGAYAVLGLLMLGRRYM